MFRPHRPPHRPPRDRRGAALVELAVLSPLFLALVLMSVEIAASIHTIHRMGAALRESGRLASQDWNELVPVEVNPNAKIEQDLENFLTAAGVDLAGYDFEIVHADGDSAGQPFQLGAPGTRLELFRMTLSLPVRTGFFTQSWFGDRFEESLVFRAGREIRG